MLLEEDSEAQMARYLGLSLYEWGSEEKPRKGLRNGWYDRDYTVPILGWLLDATKTFLCDSR